ncbi:dienelactone hydrolase family protein [Rhodococcus spongiicola]|uniref:Carboxymethylenebutenolidase n=1 Tax=Rhodococcus spongiicola TaxID=2487352 RepID=A0A438AQR8_9NOCA|nr:dienelactone hydrolase family protein [Rhodococcus spongiicola]RVW00871.1 carboxymethylenebutenolidase [Rhodococcus spongiicola]
MPGILRASVTLRADGSDPQARPRVPLTAVEPERHARGGIVVLHESRVFTDALIELMGSLAAEGWLVVAPHLFHREPAHSDAEVFGQNLFDDFDATFDWLVDRGIYPDCVGVLGFDDAGSAAMLVATNRPVGAVVSVSAHGIVHKLTADTPTLVEAAPALKAPWLALYGADDPRTPPAHVDLLREAVAHAEVATNIVSYAGLAHRADEPPVPEPGAADDDPLVIAILDAQRRIFNWFDANLR